MLSLTSLPFRFLSRPCRRFHRSSCSLRSSAVRAIDGLESRLLLTVVNMSDSEQLMLELINRARANPTEEATRYGISLNQNLAANTISTVPKQPLAAHQTLENVAVAHSLDMLSRNFFAHTNPDSTTAGGRATAAGYNWNLIAENIAYVGYFGTANPTAQTLKAHELLFKSAGHRVNILRDSVEEVGVGIRDGAYGLAGSNATLVTELFGQRNLNPFITGVVYSDTNDSNFYDIGEAVRAGTVTARRLSDGATFTETIGISGGYGIIVPAGSYSVEASFTVGGVPSLLTQTVTVNTLNIKADFDATTAQPVQLNGTTLNIRGTNLADVISVTKKVTSLGEEKVNVLRNGVNYSFNFSAVAALAIDGYAGADRLTVDSQITIPATILGGDGNDTLTGGGGADQLSGGSGNDTYIFDADTFLGSDTVTDTAGMRDLLNFRLTTTRSIAIDLSSTSAQVINEGLTLTLSGSNVLENVIGGSKNDTLTGNARNNTLNGGPGADRLMGREGNDLLIGGPGADMYLFDTDLALGSDTVDESGGGIDGLNFSSTTTRAIVINLAIAELQVINAGLSLTLGAGNTIENVFGGSLGDTLLGNSLSNRIVGNSGHDILVGFDGNDRLEGVAGRDLLIGGNGLDILLGGTDDDIVIGGQLQTDALLGGLNAFRTEWTSVRTYAQRIQNLRAGVGPSNASLKAGVSVLNDSNEVDTITGSTGNDWYFRAVDDVITDLLSTEIVDLL